MGFTPWVYARSLVSDCQREPAARGGCGKCLGSGKMALDVLTITGESYRLREKRRAGVLNAPAATAAPLAQASA